MIGHIELADLDKLDPMPGSVIRLAEMVSRPDSSMSDVIGVIELDQALTANVLRLANSAWSASTQRIATVRNAVLRLGAGRILGVAVGERVSRVMVHGCPGYELGEYELWRHSVAAALAAENMRDFASSRIPGAAFTAALLHDIGKLILSRHLAPDLVGRIRDTARTDNIDYLQAERRVLGTDHAEVGGIMARQWQFPAQIVNAIAHHHDPDAQPEPVLDAVHIANVVAKLNGVGLGSEGMNMKASLEAAARLGMTSTGLESLCATVSDELIRTEEFWGTKKNGS